MKDALMGRYPAMLARLRGFEFREGWAPLIDSALAVINQLDPDFQPSVIKEKFGGLRAQGGFVSPEGRAVIGAAEQMSLRVCELSGRRGRLGRHSGGVWQTLALGVKPGFRIALGDDAVLIDQSIADVVARHADVLLGSLRGIPEGYADLIDAAAESLLQRRFGVRATFDGLNFSVFPEAAEVEAVTAFFEHLSSAVDPATGTINWKP